MGRREITRRAARLDALAERLTPRPPSQLVPPEAVPAATELAFLTAHGDEGDAGRRSLLALRLHALLPLPGRPDHPSPGLRAHLARREAAEDG